MAEAVMRHRPNLRLGIYVGKKSADLFGRVDRPYQPYDNRNQRDALRRLHRHQITKQIKTGATDFVESDISAQGRVQFVPL